MSVSAQTSGDSLKVSLLTCSPGTQVYQLYGHTALRVVDGAHGMDIVFNYGVFDFRKPHFMWRFILGECDYEVAPYPFDLFMREYRERGSSVTEQVLALMPEETLRLYRNLLVNVQPENKTYRYNFLTNNCTTKARDMIEQAVDGHVVYPEADLHLTYRQLLHSYTEDYPWSEQGNDILLGADCDTVLSDRAMQFLPERLMEYVDGAKIFDDEGNRHPLLGETRVLLQEDERLLHPVADERFAWLTPLAVGLIALGLALLIVVAEQWMCRQWWLVDVLLMTLQGLAGVLLCFMFVFSKHPTMDSNWQIWVFNPLPLFCVAWVVRCARRRKVCLYHYVNILWLTLFVVFSLWIPQDFSVLTLPLALVLLTRPVSYYLNYNRR